MARVPDVKCAGTCGKLMWGSNTSLPEGKAMCRECRAKLWSHGTAKAYRKLGCRCEECVAWNRRTHYEYTQRRASGEFGLKACNVESCGNEAWARALCRMHYKRWARANGLSQSPSDKWGDIRRSNSHARRSRMNGGTSGDRVLLADLLIRDGATCSACERDIDIDIPYPDPHSPSVDHTIPLSKGGAHTMANCTVMHLRCNISKGARLLEGDSSATEHEPARQG